jgi:hypothetical protein
LTNRARLEMAPYDAHPPGCARTVMQCARRSLGKEDAMT